MKRIFNIFILAIVVLLSAGCAGPTPYQKAADHGGLGYSHDLVQDNTYRVYFIGAYVKDQAPYLEYWHRRAKELCEEMGFQGYRVIRYEQREGGKSQAVEKKIKPQEGWVPEKEVVSYMKDTEVSTRPASVYGEVECLQKTK